MVDKSRSTALSSTRFVLVIETVPELDKCLNYSEKNIARFYSGISYIKDGFFDFKMKQGKL